MFFLKKLLDPLSEFRYLSLSSSKSFAVISRNEWRIWQLLDKGFSHLQWMNNENLFGKTVRY